MSENPKGIDANSVVGRIIERMQWNEGRINELQVKEKELAEERKRFQDAIDECRVLLGQAPERNFAPTKRAASSERIVRPPEVRLRRLAMAKGFLRGGRTMSVAEIHSALVRQMGTEDAGTLGALSQFIRTMPEVFKSVSRGAWTLADGVKESDD